MNLHTKKSSITSEAKYIDKNPTQVKLEDGRIANPDKEGRFSVAHMKNGERKYLYDGKEVGYENAFGALTGKDTIPSKMLTSTPYKPGQYEQIFRKE